ncbi:hypothetical protein Cfla_0950 [Cellulomonas flavigena DSM 20109]|uniref:Uncharacterized protein n=1 Tax=Cellulomonas flavigena (strain ATCC 482 / DSM 20109 / BCRC 11376 / JCM 18109 / NBRC 3775 / NCIMB 8073 / NRS 134) TaxID=446466 RepID=D5UKN9_CELFN|nr:hypothetical protein [Cellulomonas flavigena]ADG73857.1 hypothetical protein Cfla_0950 [Cellulomonas flavigena DSM 20109]
MTNGVRAISRARLFDLLGTTGGTIDLDSLDTLRGALRELPVRTIAGFHLALERELERLDPAPLCHDDGTGAVGDGLRALQLAVVARGQGEVDRVARRRDPVVVTYPPEYALELAEVAFEVCEEKGEDWPLVDTGDLYDDDGQVEVVSVWFEAQPVPHDACSQRVAELLAVWDGNRAYADAVPACGLRAFRCAGAIYWEDALWGPPGTRWSASQAAGVVETHFTLDVTELPVRDAAAGERYVRDLVDRCARRWGLPDADEVFGPEDAP